MPQIYVNQAKVRLEELVENASQGEEVVITRGDRAAFKLVPALEAEPQPRFGSAKGQVWMSDDFNEPLDDFSGYRPASSRSSCSTPTLSSGSSKEATG